MKLSDSLKMSRRGEGGPGRWRPTQGGCATHFMRSPGFQRPSSNFTFRGNTDLPPAIMRALQSCSRVLPH